MALVRAAEDRQGPAVGSEAGRDKGGVQGGGGWARRCGVAAAAWAGRSLFVRGHASLRFLRRAGGPGGGGHGGQVEVRQID